VTEFIEKLTFLIVTVVVVVAAVVDVNNDAA
jgi:hypothetical protein